MSNASSGLLFFFLNLTANEGDYAGNGNVLLCRASGRRVWQRIAHSRVAVEKDRGALGPPQAIA
jgi:hypothetical protein